MKRFSRLICLVVVFAMLAAIPAYATEASARASIYFSSYRAYCTKTSSTELTVSFMVVGTGEMDEIGASKIKVQRSSDGENWTTVKTFNKADYPNMTDTNTGGHGSTVSCTVASGYYYRAYVEFYAANSNGFGERYYYTAKV